MSFNHCVDKTCFVRLIAFITVVICNLQNHVLAQADLTDPYLVLRMPDSKAKVDSILSVTAAMRKDQNKYQRMDTLFREAFRIVNKIHYADIEPGLNNAYGVYKRDNSEFYEAIELHKNALELSKKSNNIPEQIKALNNIGVAYRRLDESSTALNYHLEGLKLAEKTGDDFSVSVSLNSIGNIHIALRNYRDAIGYFERSLAISEKQHNELGIAINLNNIGESYERLGLLNLAKSYYMRSLKMNEKIRMVQGPKGIAINYNSIGNVLIKQGKLMEALELFKKGLVINLEIGDGIFVANSYNNFGGIYYATKDYANAIASYQQALAISRNIKSKYEASAAYEGLMKSAEAIGDFKSALGYSKNFKIYNDSIVNENNSRHIRMMESIYDKNKEQVRIALLESNHKNDRILMLGSFILFFLLFISGLLYYLRHKLLERNRSLQRELEIRMQIATDLHDDMGSSLSSIYIFSELLRNSGNHSNELLSKIEANAKDTLEALDDIIWLVKPSNDKFSNLGMHISEYALPLFESKNIDFDIDFPESVAETPLPMETRRNIFLIIKESVNNLVKYSDCSHASIKAFFKGNDICFVVKDDGCGFDPSKLTNRNGLKNLKARANQIHADIDINSAPGMGTEIMLLVKAKELTPTKALPH